MSSISRTNGGGSGVPVDDDFDDPGLTLDGPSDDLDVQGSGNELGGGGIDSFGDGLDAGAPKSDQDGSLLSFFGFGGGGTSSTSGPEPMTIDQLLLYAWNELTSGSDGPSAPPPTATDAGGTLADATIERQSEVTRRPMDDISLYVPKNNSDKIAVLGGLFAADKALQTANTKLADATTKANAAHEKLAGNPTSVSLKAAATKADQAVTAAETAVTKAQANVTKAETALVKLMKKQSPGKDAEIDALDISARKETQTTYDVKVGGKDIRVMDDVQSYATTHRSGLATVGNRESVAPVIDATNLSESTKKILKATSASEGDFSSINGYDRMNLSFGYIQFAGGDAGQMLPRVLQKFKDQDPASFQDSLGQYGIDVAGRPAALVCRDHDGNQLRGDDAARFIGSDPQLAAVLAASGTRTSMKTAQVEVSARILTDVRAHAVPTAGAKISDVITSEYGNGLLYDRSVNLGSGGTQKAFDDIARKYLKDNPGADLKSDPARAAVEAAFISWAEGQAPDRATRISGNTDHEAGTFVP